MSAEPAKVWWTKRVRMAKGIRGVARAVAFFLADVADEHGESFYSQAAISDGCGFAVRPVRDALHALEALGVISIAPPTPQRQTPTYRLSVDALHRLETPIPPAADADPPGGYSRSPRRETLDPPAPDADKVSMKCPEEEPIEAITEATTARDDEPPNESDPTMHQTIADDIRRRHNSATDPAFVAALDHVVTRWAGTLAKLAEGPTGAHNVGASYPGSRPKTDTDPIDNDGATTPPSVPAVSSPSNPTNDEASNVPSSDGPDSGGVDRRLPADVHGAGRPAPGARADHASDQPDVGRVDAVGVSTLSPAPATSEASAPDKPDSGSLLTLSGAPPQRDESTIARIIAAVRAHGSDAKDIRDAAHEAAHAIEWKVKAPWTRERIHAKAPKKAGLFGLARDEARARAVEAAVCAAVGVPYDPSGWHPVAVLELMRVCPVSVEWFGREVERQRDSIGDVVGAIFDLQPPKAKTGAKAAAQTETIAAIAAQVDRMMGRTGAALPGSGRWKMLVTAVNEAGADRVLARVTAMGDAAQGLTSPATAIFEQMGRSDYGTDPILRGNNGWTVKLDDAIEAAVRRSDASGAAGAMTTRVESQNARQPQPAPKQNGSAAWDDMLTIIRSTGGLRLSLGLRGSTLSHEPGEHKRRCQAVADIGGWAKLCEMGEGNRGIIRAQFVAAYDRLSVTA